MRKQKKQKGSVQKMNWRDDFASKSIREKCPHMACGIRQSLTFRWGRKKEENHTKAIRYDFRENHKKSPQIEGFFI